jgi:hypothetical protein
VIRHIVFFKLNDGVTRADAAAGAAAFEALGPDVIPALRRWEVGWNVSDRPIAWDFCILAEIDDMAALAEYAGHPAHVAASDLWVPISQRCLVDVEVPQA